MTTALLKVFTETMSIDVYLFIDIPIQRCVLQDKPVFFPFLGEITLGIFLFPKPAFTVPSTKIFT